MVNAIVILLFVNNHPLGYALFTLSFDEAAKTNTSNKVIKNGNDFFIIWFG